MAETRRREAAEDSGRRQRAVSAADMTSAVQPTTLRHSLPADVASAPLSRDTDAAVDVRDAGDRKTPVALPMPSLVDATAVGPGSSAMPITIPPAAVEVTAAAPSLDRHPEAPPEPERESLVVRSADPRALKTRLARKLTTLADEVNECFADFRVGAAEWRVELTAPEGMSTGGAKHALQNLRLVPDRPAHATIAIGVVDPIDQTAELRDYAYVARSHVARFAIPFEVTADEWEGVLSRCEVVLKLANIRTARIASSEVVVAPARPRRGLPLRPIAIGALLVLFSALVIWRIAMSLFG